MAKKKLPWSRRLKRLRALLGDGRKPMTQTDAAAKAGVSAAAWIAWENNQRSPSSITARLLELTFPQLADID